MSGPVSVTRDGDVAIVTIDSPPVNALSHPVRAGLLVALQEVERDASVRTAVIACAGRTFVAGADITVNATLLEDQPQVAEARRPRSAI